MSGGALTLRALLRLARGGLAGVGRVTETYGYAQNIWFGLARELPPSASAFSIMAVPVVGTLPATLIVGERPGWTDLVAIVCVSVAIASALLPRKPA